MLKVYALSNMFHELDEEYFMHVFSVNMHLEIYDQKHSINLEK